MAPKTDLTFAELNQAFTGMGIANAIVTDAQGKLTIDIGAVNGVAITGTSSTGVMEFVYKLRNACGHAQELANTTLGVGDRLSAFPAFSYGAPIDGKVSVTQLTTTLIPLNDNNVSGPTV